MDKQAYFAPIAKYVPRLIGHQLPFGVGSAISLASAVSRLGDQDLAGAGLDALSGITGILPGVGLPLSLAADLVNLSRDVSREGTTDSTRSNKINLMNRSSNIKTSDFKEDISTSIPSENSTFYKSLSPVLDSGLSEIQSPEDLNRINSLKNEVRKGLISLDYLTGQKKNKAESYYDANPAAAVGLDLLKKAPTVGAGVAGIGVLENLRRQAKNMKLLEPAKMSRTDNPLDPTNPSELLNPQGKRPARSDISSIFGDFDQNTQKRLELLDRVQGNTGNSFAARYKSLLDAEKALGGTADMDRLNTELKDALEREAAGGGKKQRKKLSKQPSSGKIKNLLNYHTTGLENQRKAIEDAKNKLLQEAQASSGNTALQKYVNLHESLRRSGGNLKGYIGEGLGPLSGIADLAEKYHITGANPNFDRALLTDIALHHGGAARPEQMQKFLSNTLSNLSETAPASGFTRFFRRNKLPLLFGGGLAAAGGLYPLIKNMQLSKYPKSKINEWKKTILKSRGDFEAVKALEEQEKLDALQEQELQPA